jgi:2,4-didehydro-3-deoxy-L-rhamnonate hydrolase
MKLVRHGDPGKERPGLIDAQGRLRDLSAKFSDEASVWPDESYLQRIAGARVEALPLVETDPRLGACVSGTRNFIAVGLNYAEHAQESGFELPKEPVLFNKAPSCISGPRDELVIPPGSQHTDWEVELAVVIGRAAYRVPEDDALSIVAGYCVCNDASERSFQLERGGQWTKGKGCPTFGPLGPWLVTPDEIPDVQALDLWLNVNGRRMQTGNTRTMIFPVRYLISYISQFMRLEPGDVITTGTPPGVGLGLKPPQYLRPGDVIELGISGLGEQRQLVVASDSVGQAG